MVDLQAIVAVVAGAAGGTAITAANVRTVHEVAKEFAGARERILRHRRPRHEVHEAKRLLGLHQRDSVVYRSDNVHSMYAGTLMIHPDNRRALLAAAGDDYLAAEEAGVLEIQDIVSADLGQHLVLIGSPTSEGISRLLFYETFLPPRGSLRGTVSSPSRARMV